MSEIREMLVDSTVKIMKDLCTKEIVNDAEAGIWPEDLWGVMEESGFTTIAVSEEAGGSGGSFGDALSMLRVIGKFSAPIPLAETLVANWVLEEVGLTISEKPSTIIPQYDKPPFSFTKAEGGWIVSGTANGVPWARYSNRIVIFGRSADVTMAAVIDPKECIITSGDNLAGEPRDSLEINKLFITVDNAAPISEGTLLKYESISALVKAVLMTGALERILELMTIYSKERTQFGRHLHRFQAIQQHIATVAAEVTAANIATEYGIKAIDTNEFTIEAMITKVRVGEAVSISVPIVHQVVGAIGFTDEHVLHQSTRRLWAWRDENGTESHWAEKFGEIVLSVSPDKLWPLLTKVSSQKVENA